MAVVREFYSRGRGEERETFSLARDVLTDQVFILHSTVQDEPELTYRESTASLAEFLQKSGSEQTALIDLIGTLVVEV